MRIALIVLLFIELAMQPPGASAATPQETIGWYVQAQALERANRPLDAAAFYRRVWQGSPTRTDAVLRGTRLLGENGRSDEALTWLGAATEQTPQDAVLWVEYGDILDRSARTADADSAWQHGSARASDLTAFHLGVAERLVARGQQIRARQWLIIGKQKTNGQPVFSRRLFDIAVALGDGRATAEAASDYVRGEPGRVQEINEALQELSLPASVLDTMAAAATSLSDADSADAARALLAAEWALGTTSQGVAPRYFIRSAAAGRDPVNALFAAANQLEGRGFSDVATYLHESLALTFPQSPFSQRSALVAADRFAAMGKRARATSLYEWIISRGNSPYEDDARIAFGHTLLAGDSISAAQRQFGWAASRGRTVQLRRQGTFGLAQCAVRSGRLDEAQSLLEPLADSTMAFSDAARAYLRLAEINLYHGDAVTMQQHCNAVILRSSGSDEANDCLELSGILAEANGDTLAWQAYGELAYLLATKQLEFVLTKATEFDNGPLTGRARLVEADALLSLGRLEAAAKALSSTASANDSSAVGEEALWRYGELQRTLMGNPQEALRSYERFLQTFPQSVYLGHARHWIRELRTEVGPL